MQLFTNKREAEAVRRHLCFVLRWFQVYVEACPGGQVYFIRAYRDSVGEELIVLPISVEYYAHYEELHSFRNLLPVKESSFLTLALVDRSLSVLLYTQTKGISDDLEHRKWRPNRVILDNPERALDRAVRQRAREAQEASNNAPHEEVIIIDD